MISLADFKKVEMKTARVLEVARVEGSEKLLKLKIDLGSETRQIISGIGRQYEPENLTGKMIVIVSNLEPRSLMGLESQGMIVAAGDALTVSLLTPDREISPGSEVR